ncbi:UDP-2,3-diacylglucosamine diphosphatase [Ectothiorhodospira lacustris]|uniref:UDP-2,3-diacylglucosamine diphosphatase n=1 Tax=Ectothiorhodospira lacustris TaxID=2899127 RepID=UPI001EE8B0A6|nr:UDP-2,3-diacylglucosamine diphosphatase [Ectothiorhodospira lacustris]MCG5510932.1 UDP-2,3-diacylglucosamine diphosphatase [Ectothiorhodospira lacustris]MCG5522664.1 UDP-2,3-diacylglucosamine diphosphatase [Ectothiorhodospira lacustris]
MSETLFISDLHLDKERPHSLRLFERFLQTRVPGADALYILGDLFEYWVGDDDPAPHLDRAFDLLSALSEQGMSLFFVHGNRDFLVGETFARRCGCQLLETETVVELYGTAALIMHGDSLCTDDVDYMAFRTLVRDPQWQAAFLARPLDRRHAEAEAARARSRSSTRNKSAEITDVNARAVTDALRRHGVQTLIHGHTHRPAIHDLTVAGRPARRIVLPDWYDTGGLLVCRPDGMSLENL